MGAQDTDRETITGETRWLKNLFFDGAPTKYPRLDELHNAKNPNVTGVGDMTDYELACEILRRAGLGTHWKFSELAEMFAECLFHEIDDPMRWLNPVYDTADKSERKITGTTTEVVEQMTTPPKPKSTSTTKNDWSNDASDEKKPATPKPKQQNSGS